MPSPKSSPARQRCERLARLVPLFRRVQRVRQTGTRESGMRQHVSRVARTGLIVGFVGLTAGVLRSQSRSTPAEWRYFGGDKAFTRYSPLDQITRDNVKNLRIVWRRAAVSDQLTQAFADVRVTNYLRSTPIVLDGMLFAQNAHGLVVAFDGETGKTVWEQELFARTREEANGQATRGVGYWQ